MQQALQTVTQEWLDNPANVPPEFHNWLLPLAPAIQTEEADNQTTMTFTMGQPTVPLAQTRQATGPWAELPVAPLPEGTLSKYKSFTRKEIAISDSLDEIERYSITDERRYGLFLHNVLSRVTHIDDLPRAMHATAYRARLSQAEEEAQLQILQKALADPRVQPWFGDCVRVVNERPASTTGGVRRPDRIVWLPDGRICVIDYKFGAEKKSYSHQVRRYMDILTQMGYNNVSGYLWYPLTGIIRQVHPDTQQTIR